MPDGHTSDIHTTGSVTVGGSTTGNVETGHDRDWFAVELVAGRTYVIDLEGSPTAAGTLSDTYLWGIHDSGGNLITGTTNDDDGLGYNSRLSFEAAESGTHYIAAGAYGTNTGSYTVGVTDVTPPPDDFGDTAASAGEIAVGGSVTGEIGEARDFDWFALDVVAGRTYVIDLEGSGTDAGTLVNPVLRGLFGADGDRLQGTTPNNDGGEGLNSRMTWTAPETGTVYVVARGAGSSTGTYTLRVADTDPATAPTATVVTDPAPAPEAPAFGRPDYAFALPENVDGSTSRVSLGTVSAVDPEGAAVEYSLVGGNEAGLFEVDGQTGELFYTGGGEDYESGATQFDLSVRASDGTLSADTSVTVDITDEQEQSIVEPPVPETLQSVSEAAGEDFSTDTSTVGRVAIGGIATGRIWTSGDRDGFAVDLVAGRTYVIDLRGSPTGDGTLSDPYLRGIKGPGGDRIANTSNDDRSDEDRNSQLSFTPTESGTHYIIAGAYSGRQGTYEVEVADTDPAPAPEAPAFEQPDYAFALPENVDGSTSRVLLGRVSAVDPEGATVEYSLVGGNEAGLFEVDPQTGELFYTGGGEDYESGTSSYELAVRASDGTQSADTAATVDITDVEEPGRAPTTITFVEGPPDEEEPVVSERQGVSVSEPADQDFAQNTSTTGGVGVGESVTGNVDRTGDRDWFEVTLDAGTTYRINLHGRPWTGALPDPYLHGVYDGNGVLISGTRNDNNPRGGYDSEVFFTPEQDGAYYIAAGANGNGQGTYTLFVTEIVDDVVAGTETTDTIAVNGSATGEIESWGDRDWFKVTLEVGKSYNFDVWGSQAGRQTSEEGTGLTLADPYLYGLRDENGALIEGTTNDNRDGDWGNGKNAGAVLTVTEGGAYYVDVGANGNGTGTYGVLVREIEDDFRGDTLTDGEVIVDGQPVAGRIDYGGDALYNLFNTTDPIRELPGRYWFDDRDWFKVELQADTTYRIDLEDINAGPWRTNTYLHGVHDEDGVLIAGTTNDNGGQYYNSRVYFTAPATGAYYVAAGATEFTPGILYQVRVTDVTDDFGDTPGTAGGIQVGGSKTGQIGEPGDFDWFAVRLQADKTYQIDLRGQPYDGTLNDPLLRGVYDGRGNFIGGTKNDDSSAYTLNSRVYFTPAENGTYYVEAASGYGIRDDVGTYTLEVIESM